MITDEEKSLIVKTAKKYHVKQILLFGSNLQPGPEANDIDLAVEGILPEHFFRFYGELLFGLDKPVDLIDLSVPGRFTDIVKKEGICLYGDAA
jgi:predicted nucleotidyltransferase